MQHLERQYLIAAYELAKNGAMHMFNEDEIANHLDLDPSQPGYLDRFVALTRYHLDNGFITPVSKGGGTGRRSLKLTREGLEEAERLVDPVEQRKEQRRRFLRAVYDLADGNPGEFVYWPGLAPRMGWDPENGEHEEEAFRLAQNAAQAGLIKIEVSEGGIYSLTARGIAAVEGDEPQATTGPTFQFYGNVQGSVIGTHNKAELRNTFDFRSIEERIEREGGDDKEDLKQALARVKRLVECGDYLDRGALSEFSGAMERHSWFTGSVMQALLGFATQAAG